MMIIENKVNLAKITEAPPKSKPMSIPDVWEMNPRGIEWCECGADHAADRDTILDFAEGIADDPDYLTHEDVVYISANVWYYDAVCRFFMLAIEEAAIAVNGEVGDKYLYETGLAIISYFTKTWQGCPQISCEAEYEI